MKKTTTLLTRFVSLTFLAALPAHANLIWYEGFQYPDGSLTSNSVYTVPGFTTNSLWIRESGTAPAPGDMLVANSNLQVTATSGTYISRQDDCARWLYLTNGIPAYTNTHQVLYASFTVICSTAISNGAGLPNGAGSYFASFYSMTNTSPLIFGYGYFGRVQALTNRSALPNTWRLGVSNNQFPTNANDGGWPSSVGGIDLAVNTPYQVVEELDPLTLDAASIWVNPINLNQSGSAPVDPIYTAGDGLLLGIAHQVNSFAFRQSSSFGSSAFIITNLAIATTFAEAMTNVMATNAVPPVIVYQPVGATNFAGSLILLSAVANGQGLGNMTYQWQVSSSPNNTSPVNVTGGNFSGVNGNILTDNSALAGDTGYYSLIATTPWGLSATSAVTEIFIRTDSVPPIFVSEPVNHTVYRGQNVTFSTRVESPGNVTFTWYSNNVVVTAGVSVSGDTSSLELDNVTTNCSANYSVAVTNDAVVNGVVSTNGVLTVLNPPVVSIIYLRSLQDVAGGTYAPTVPLTQPYQATGTVTTFTNVTTGNTSSYYLQDGTAGINIFVTGGSTFRPAQGAVVTFVGVLSSFGTGLELYADSADSQYPYTSYVDTGDTAPLPTPRSIPMNFVSAYGLPYVNTNLGGSLVTLSDVYFGARAGTTISASANDVIAVTNSLGQTCNVEFFDLDLDTTNQTLPSHAYSVTGVMYGFNSTWSVGVTRWADVVTNLLSPTSIAITSVSRSGNNVTLNWAPAPAGSYTYSVERAATLSNPSWTTLQTGISGTSYTDIGVSAATGFYRVSSP